MLDSIEFRELVSRMRNAQRAYFKKRDSDSLRDAKQLEEEVDRELRESNNLDNGQMEFLF